MNDPGDTEKYAKMREALVRVHAVMEREGLVMVFLAAYDPVTKTSCTLNVDDERQIERLQDIIKYCRARIEMLMST